MAHLRVLAEEFEPPPPVEKKGFWARLRCKHDWDLISNPWTTCAATARYRCKKCGKEEGL